MPETTDAEMSQPAVASDPEDTPRDPSVQDGQPEPTGDSGLTESTAGEEASDDTGLTSQIQAEISVSARPEAPETPAQRMTRRQANVEAELREKEAILLNYVWQRFPAGYYRRAKAEANEFFNQAVIYRLRRHRHGKTPSKR